MEDFIYIIAVVAITILGIVQSEAEKKKKKAKGGSIPTFKEEIDSTTDTESASHYKELQKYEHYKKQLEAQYAEEELSEGRSNLEQSTTHYDTTSFNQEGVKSSEVAPKEASRSIIEAPTEMQPNKKKKKKSEKFNMKRAIIYSAILEPKFKEQ